MNLKAIKIPQAVADEVDSITGTISGTTVYYSEDGDALILDNEGTYIISVESNDTSFNNGNPTTHSAYLVNQPVEDIVSVVEDTYTSDHCDVLKGWTTGWEC